MSEKDRVRAKPERVDCPGPPGDREVRYAPYREKVREHDKREC